MDSNAIAPGIPFPELEMISEVLCLETTGFAVIATLNDMAGMPGKVHPRTPRHVSFLTIRYSGKRLDSCLGDLWVGQQIIFPAPFHPAVPLFRAFMGQTTRILFEKVNVLPNKASGILMPVILLLLGATLSIDAIYYFVTGEAVF